MIIVIVIITTIIINIITLLIFFAYASIYVNSDFQLSSKMRKLNSGIVKKIFYNFFTTRNAAITAF